MLIANKTGWISNEGQENELFDLDPTNLDGVSSEWNLFISPNYPTDKQPITNNFKPTDSDFELEFVDINDTSYTPPFVFGQPFGIRFTRVPLPILPKNINNEESAELLFLDFDDTDDLTAGDKLILCRRDSKNRIKYLFTIEFIADGSDIAPSPGDKIRISTTREFGSDDSFQFAMRASSLDNELAKKELDDIYVVPNPYVGGASWERPYRFAGRGERRIEFFNLPSICTVRIFNIRGELIRTLEHDGGVNDGSLAWDLVSNDDEEVAYGVYFYHVKAPGIGEYVNKFAIIK